MKMCTKSLQWCLTLCDPMDTARLFYPRDSLGKYTGMGCQAPHPLPGDLPDPRIEPTSLMSFALAGRFFTISAT